MNMPTHASRLVLAITALLIASPALAQHDMASMPGMTMPTPTRKPAAKASVAKPAGKAAAKSSQPAKNTASKAPRAANPHAGMDMSGMDMSGMDHAAMGHGAPKATKPPAKPVRKAPVKKKQTAKRSASVQKAAAPAAPAHDMSAMPGMGHGTAPAGSAPPMTGDHDMSAMPGMDMSGMDHSGTPPASAGATAPTTPAAHDMSSMPGMEGMDHAGMDMGSMPGMGAPADLPADAAPRTPVPALTDADRAAAFAPLGAAHPTHDQRTHSYWLLDRLEAREGGGGAWDATAWIGGDINRLWLRSEGEVADGRVEDASVEALYGRAISPWWDVVGGVRVDTGDGPDRAYAAFGVQGLAPYKFEVQATGYLGTGGRTAARLEAEYDTLLTNRLILQWRSEANLYGGSDPARRLGTGLSTIEAGARLRFEITRRFAPYIGVEVERAVGETADLRRADGDPVNDTRLVAGLRLWF
jgi:copper resistance protein B